MLLLGAELAGADDRGALEWGADEGPVERGADDWGALRGPDD